MTEIASWAKKMQQYFIAGTSSQFILYGNIFDYVPVRDRNRLEFISLRTFLNDVMFAPFDVVIFYDRGKGIRVKKGQEEFRRFLAGYDSFNHTNYATFMGNLPREPKVAIDLIDRFIQLNLQKVKFSENDRNADGTLKSYTIPVKIAIVIDYAQYVVPRGELMQMVGNTSEVLIKILDWASDPAITNAHVATCLITENLQELNTLLIESPYNTKIKLPMPDENELADYCRFLSERMSDYHEYCKIEPKLLGAGMLGLTKAGVNSIISFAIKNKQELNPKILSQNKKSYIEKECNDLLEFIESPYNLDMVAGHRAAKKWLKEDAELIRNGKLRSIPMGYLLTGGIGTGKTFLANCWAGELGIPFVKFKNFRDKWQGSTEGNLEKIFTVLDALGQVIVFIDEADQSTGKREGGGGDSGVSGRVYSMLAQKMSDTKNRGKIIWILATSRPDLLEVDLKRQGRLDVHIPLFAPQTDEDRNELFKVVAKKSGSDLKDEDIPTLPAGLSSLGGNEMEALLVRAHRQFDLQKTDESLAEILKNLLKDFRPSAYTAALEYMDLIAVKECTDSMFLPEKYKSMTPEELDEKIEHVKHRMSI